eukprot:15114501-Alexandrium_andersonii.AAC.1
MPAKRSLVRPSSTAVQARHPCAMPSQTSVVTIAIRCRKATGMWISESVSYTHLTLPTICSV